MEPDQVEAHVDALLREGYTVLPNAVERELLDALLDDLRGLGLFEQEGQPNAFEGRATGRLYNLLAKGTIYQQVPVHPGVLPVIEAVLDEGCQISSLSAISLRPGEVAQVIHADDLAFRMPRPHPVPLVCTAMWALTDFTVETGATRVIPRSHLAEHSPDWRRDPDGNAALRERAIPVEMERGSVLLYLGSLWHGGGANRSAEPRVGMPMSYCAGWVRPQENQLLGIPLEVLRSFPSRLREMAGLAVYDGQMGHIDRERPANLLFGPASDETDGQVAWDPPITRPPRRLEGSWSPEAP